MSGWNMQALMHDQDRRGTLSDLESDLRRHLRLPGLRLLPLTTAVTS